ncbi:hypothetical protein SDJN02_20973, partial [Cucurbita argyrosperma subsp. argyrosperma]
MKAKTPTNQTQPLPPCLVTAIETTPVAILQALHNLRVIGRLADAVGQLLSTTPCAFHHALFEAVTHWALNKNWI